MISYFYVNSENTIVSVGKVSSEEEIFVIEGATLHIGEVPSGMNKYIDGSFSYVKEYNEYLIEALQKRNALLADGPDRISPVWWEAMTLEEQQSWIDYRQALLDVTSQPNYPQEIVWPIKP